MSGLGFSTLLALGGCFSTDGIVYTRADLGAKVPIASGDYVCISGIGLGKDLSVSHLQVTERVVPTLGDAASPKYEYELGGGSVQFVPVSGSLYLIDVSEPMVADSAAMPSQALRGVFISQNTFQMLQFTDDIVIKVAASDGVLASHDPIMGWTLTGSTDQQRRFFADLLVSPTGVTVDEACGPDIAPAPSTVAQPGYGIGGGAR
jgi:hypothetical protein